MSIIRIGRKVAGLVYISDKKLIRLVSRESKRKYNPVTTSWEYKA